MARKPSPDLPTPAEGRRARGYTRMYLEQEIPVLRRFGLRNGMSVVELGSGPGIVTDLLVHHFQRLTVTSVDFREAVAKRARAYLGGRGHQGVRVVHGDIRNTGLPEETFDFAYARLVFRFLPDPLEAVREASRILKPGGALAIIDGDLDLWGIFQPPLPEFRPVLEAYARRLRERGGDAHIGRRLPGLLTEGGFVGTRLETIAITSRNLPEGLDMETFLAPVGLARLERLVKGDWLSEEDAQHARVAWDRFLGGPSRFALKVMVAALGRKPPE